MQGKTQAKQLRNEDMQWWYLGISKSTNSTKCVADSQYNSTIVQQYNLVSNLVTTRKEKHDACR